MHIQINHLQHIGIPVTNLDVSSSFYAAFGFSVVLAESFVYEQAPGKMKMMKRGEIILELYQLPDKLLPGIRSRQNGHIDHIAFDVDDVDLVFKTLKENGYQIMEPEPVFLDFWGKGCRYFNITGPDGERLEFNQILK